MEEQLSQALVTIGVGLIVFVFGQIFLELFLDPLLAYREAKSDAFVF